MTQEVVLIPGDGIGPEASLAMTQVLKAAKADVSWVEAQAGAGCIEKFNSPLPDATLELVRQVGVAIKGPVTTPVGTGFRSVNVALRKELDLYACVRPTPRLTQVGELYSDLDLVIIRENSEDLYAGVEFECASKGAEAIASVCEQFGVGPIKPDAGISIKPISVSGTRRIVEYAFDYAIAQGRRKVTCVHKANIMKHSDGLFLREARAVAQKYQERAQVGQCPFIEFDERIIDAFCMNLVMNPKQFDVVVLPNLYGDIASDLMAGMTGGLGIAPGANIGKDCAIFEPVHGSAPDIAGKGLANPTAEILSAVMMLKYVGQADVAARVRAAVERTYQQGRVLTGDIIAARGLDCAPASTEAFTAEVIKNLEY